MEAQRRDQQVDEAIKTVMQLTIRRLQKDVIPLEEASIHMRSSVDYDGLRWLTVAPRHVMHPQTECKKAG